MARNTKELGLGYEVLYDVDEEKYVIVNSDSDESVSWEKASAIASCENSQLRCEFIMVRAVCISHLNDGECMRMLKTVATCGAAEDWMMDVILDFPGCVHFDTLPNTPEAWA